MKLLSFLIFFGLLTTLVSAQENQRTVDVSATAEREVLPDEITFIITLMEYKDVSGKTSINELESELVAAVKKVKGISEDNLRVANISGTNWSWEKRKQDDFMARKSFQLNVNNAQYVNELLAMLDSRGVSNVYIVNVDYSDRESILLELKVEALKKAKIKAEALTEAVGAEVGKVLHIKESESSSAGRPYYTMARMEASGADYQSNVEYKDIILKASVSAVFEIVDQ